MHERGIAVEDGLIECQICKKKINVVRKILGKIIPALEDHFGKSIQTMSLLQGPKDPVLPTLI